MAIFEGITAGFEVLQSRFNTKPEVVVNQHLIGIGEIGEQILMPMCLSRRICSGIRLRVTTNSARLQMFWWCLTDPKVGGDPTNSRKKRTSRRRWFLRFSPPATR
jgi:hypothetical protein